LAKFFQVYPATKQNPSFNQNPPNKNYMIKGLKKLHSAEPACQKRSDSDHLKFVIHKKNDNSESRFDFSIELNGIKSWTVPDVPSMNPLEQRLAKLDKKIEETILDFVEGEEICELWDKGNYIPIDDEGNALSEREAIDYLKKGSLKFFLQGNKLVGEFVLIKKAKKTWLLIKRHDEFALYHSFGLDALVG
jgi:bifunctional non-homologous end joining protein LigD